MNGGYLIVSKTDTNLYEKLNKALTLGKPVLWYEDENTCYYIDTITKSGTNIILTKGGKTITIENDGDVTETGDVLTIMENIVDANGNKRFIEGDIDVTEITGITFNYKKWSLSGSHLMIVVGGTADNGSTLSSTFASVKLPKYILDKVYPLISNVINRVSTTFYKSDTFSSSQNVSIELGKGTDDLTLWASSSTMTENRVFRIQFDLLIDNE